VAKGLFLGTLCQRVRVLDAWVCRRLETAHRGLGYDPVMQQHASRVKLPVRVGEDLDQGFKPRSLQPVFARAHGCVLIYGEGGIGKTSLACEIARSAVSPDAEERPAPHSMLPVLLDSDIAVGDGNVHRALLLAVGRKLQVLLNTMEEIPIDLLTALLRNRRILVIVDRFSELGPATRELIRPAAPGFFINALVITSRLKEVLGVQATILSPTSLSKEKLSIFAHDYLTSIGKRAKLNDAEFAESISRFSKVLALAMFLFYWQNSFLIKWLRPLNRAEIWRNYRAASRSLCCITST
jgi:hypothetical protein